MDIHEAYQSWARSSALSVFLLFVYLLWQRLDTALRKIPGPFLASTTRLWHVYYILRGDQNAELVRLHDKHGYFVRIAPDEVSVSHPDGIKKILLARLHKGYWYKFLAFPNWRFQTPMSSTDPKVKIARSKYFSAGYTMTSVLEGKREMDSVIETFFTWMDNFAKIKQPVKFNWWFSFAASDVVGEKLFSEQFGFLKEGRDVGKALATTGMLNAYAAFGGFYRWIHMALFGNPLMASLVPMGHLFDTSMAALQRRQKNRESRFDMVSHWLRAQDKNPQMTERDIQAMVTGVVGAGSETVSCGLQSFVYHMNRLPGAWQKARAEISEAQKQGRCQDRAVSYEDAQKLPFIQACIKESLRIFAPVPMTLPRVAPRVGIIIGDVYFPTGTIISVSPWVVHYPKELWGPDAREFRPNRWFEEGINEKEKNYYIPFGAGYNSCPGSNIAKVEMAKILTRLVRDYDIALDDIEWKWNAYFILAPTDWAGLVQNRVA